jgi:predicted adenylyl cyclase CyaB
MVDGGWSHRCATTNQASCDTVQDPNPGLCITNHKEELFPMPTNIELKVRVSDLGAVRQRVTKLTSRTPQELVQEDIFFRNPTRRLKLRIMSPDHAELISYKRADTAGPRVSHYVSHRVADIAATRQRLEKRFGALGIVRKKRTVFFVRNTRVHLDEVENLGKFVEFEVVLNRGLTILDARRELEWLVRELGIDRNESIAGAYVDLLSSGH